MSERERDALSRLAEEVDFSIRRFTRLLRSNDLSGIHASAARKVLASDDDSDEGREDPRQTEPQNVVDEDVATVLKLTLNHIYHQSIQFLFYSSSSFISLID